MSPAWSKLSGAPITGACLRRGVPFIKLMALRLDTCFHQPHLLFTLSFILLHEIHLQEIVSLLVQHRELVGLDVKKELESHVFLFLNAADDWRYDQAD